MTDLEIIERAVKEVEAKTWGVTEQFLEIHELIHEDSTPKVAHVDRDKNDTKATVYFLVKEEKFYFAITIQINPTLEVVGVGTEPHHSIYFRATSDTLSFEQLSQLTKLAPTGGWNKGDKRKFGNATHSFSCVSFTPNLEPDEFEDKLNKLLDFLEKDVDGIRQLVAIANAHIQVATIFHNGNTMLGGFHLDKQLIKRLNALDLEIDFDLYAKGRFFK